MVARYRLHQALPFGWVALLAQPAWSVAVILIGLAVLLFPDGRLPSPRLRWLLRIYLAVALVWMAGAYGFTVSAIVQHDVQVDPSGNLRVLSDPSGSAAWWGAVQTAVLVTIAASWPVSLAGQAASYRRSSGERRQQLKWLLGGSVVVGACLALTIALPRSGVAGAAGSVSVVVAVFAPGLHGRGRPEVPALRHRPARLPDRGLRHAPRSTTPPSRTQCAISPCGISGNAIV